MIVMRIKLYRGSSGALRAEFADGWDSVSQNNAGSNVVEVVPDKSVALSENEALRIGYATSINENDPNTLNVGFTLMPFYPENGVWRAFVPPLVCKTRGKWLLNLQVVSDWDDKTEEFQYISHTVEPLEFSVKAVIQDDSGNYPNDGDILALYEEARRLENSTGRVQAEANGEVTIATIEINNPNTTLEFQNLEGMTEIDWGDGTINSELTHTYENLGVYYCRIYGLVSIGEGAFIGRLPSSNFTPITHIKISNKVTSIGDNAFTYTKLRSIEIPNSVTYIGSSFDQSHYLEKIVIPESVTYIDVDAFNMCSNLKIVELKGAPPQQIYSGDIFSFANKLEKIIVPYGMVEAYKSAPMWSDYATLIDCLVYQSDLDVSEEKITEKITENREEINKDIKNLYAITAQGGLYTMLEVEQAFVSRETADGENIVDGQYTAPTKIQGDTVACKNLFDKNLALDGYEIINTNSGTLGVSAEWFTTDYIPVRPNTSYVVSGKPDGSTVMAYNSNKEVITNLRDGISGFRTTENAAFVRLNGLLIQKDTFQLEEGTAATEYQPYFTGLKNAYFKGIKSTGKNLFNPERELSSFSATLNTSLRDFDETKVYVGMSNNNYVNLSAVTNVSYIDGIFSFTTTNNAGYGVGVPIKVKPDTQYSVSYRLITGSNVILSIGFYNKNGALIEYSYSEKTFTTSIDCAWVLLVISNNLAGSISYTDIQLEESSAATAYEPYKEDTYELPEAVELGKWDYIDIENKKVVRQTRTITLDGDENGYTITQAGSLVWAPAAHGYELAKNISSIVATPTNLGTSVRITGGYPETGYTSIIIGNATVSTVDEAKAALAANPLTFSYETLTPISTEKLTETPERYQAWKNGSETVAQGDTDNSEYGAIPTVTTEYFKLTEV